jgi:DNA-binding transcriptional LysR family regulator
MMAGRAILGQLADVDIRLLRIFRVVAEAGGVSAAELELNIGRSTISRHLKDLETRLGVTLCRRGRAGFALTDEGRQVYDATLRLLAAMDEFRDEVNDIHESITGKLVIAVFDKTVTNPGCRIYQAIEHFDQLAPRVNIELFVEPLNDIERGVMEGTYHIGVIPQHRPSASLDYHYLFNEPMHLYCGQQHPLFACDDGDITSEAILAAKYAGLGYHSPNMERGRELGMTRAATAYDQEGIATLVLSGRYIAYLPDHYAQIFVERGLMRVIGREVFHYCCEFSAIVRSSPKPGRIVATFMQQLLAVHGGDKTA